MCRSEVARCKLNRINSGFSCPEIKSEKLLNFKLLNEQAWFDIPIIYGDGLRAIVAVEKGSTGEAAFKDGLSAWR